MSSNIASLNSELKRHNFGKIKLSDHQPDLLEIQLKSFKEFFSWKPLLKTVSMKVCIECFRKISQSAMPEISSFWSFWITTLIHQDTISTNVCKGD